jgi:hypothetical protein
MLSVLILAAPASAWADCPDFPQGTLKTIEIVSCKEIGGRKNSEVRKYSGDLYEQWNLGKAYTGALITDGSGIPWMYSTTAKHACRRFAPKSTVELRAYYTCCDSGRWGKCVFGGRWVGDSDGKPVNTFQ